MLSIAQHLRDLWSATGLTTAQLHQLLSAGGHSPYLKRHRAALIIARVQVVSAIFAVLTAVWTVVDVWAFPFDLWILFASMRGVSCLIFVALAAPWDIERTPGVAFFMFTVMLINPPMFYMISQPLFAGVELDGTGVVIAYLYTLLPFVVLAGLSMFPLTVVEVLAFGLPIFAVAGFGTARSEPIDWAMLVGTLWLLFLILGVAMFSGLGQLRYMITLVRRASQDPLTGVFTRRSGSEIIDLQFRIAARQDTPFAIAYFDLDDFKTINDRFGHDAGDRMLRQTTASLRGHLRQSDALIRWGGEEFVIMLNNTDCAGARLVVSRIIEDWMGMRPDGRPLTASIGVAERMRDGMDDWPQLIELADHRMYEAKQAGKQRAFACDDEEIV